MPQALQRALAVPPLALKLSGFRAFVEDVCRRHDPAYRVVTYADEAVTSATSRAQRVRVMGSPARYAEVLYAGDQGTFETSSDVRHVVNVFLYHGTGAEDRADAADAFRTLLEGRAASRPGLLHAIRAQQGFRLSGAETDADGDAIPEAPAFAAFEVSLSAPERTRATLAYPEDFPQDDQYEAAFVVTLT